MVSVVMAVQASKPEMVMNAAVVRSNRVFLPEEREAGRNLH
jgi:hypothetical protein